MEELLFRHSFLPQRGVHPLLWRVRHQALRSGRAAVLRPARQLRRTVELVSSFPPPSSLFHFVLVQIFFFFNSETLHPSSSSCPVTSPSLVYYSSSFAHTWTQEHDLDPPLCHSFQYGCCVFFVSDITLSLFPLAIPCILPPQLLRFYKKLYKPRI